jgi:hypothetical protein
VGLGWGAGFWGGGGAMHCLKITLPLNFTVRILPNVQKGCEILKSLSRNFHSLS